MKSWYLFGFNGFPKGEERQRFYRERDDPCDSEEDNYEDNESNDRPVYYFPLNENDEISSQNSEEEVFLQPPKPLPIPYQIGSTVYEGIPSWWGSISTHFFSGDKQYSLCHGGVANATRQVDNSFRLFEIARHASDITCSPVTESAALSQRVKLGNLHPSLLSGNPLARPAAAPNRVGHCVASLPSSANRRVMRPTARDEDLPFPSTDLYHGLLKPSVKEEDAEIHLSLVVGGSSSFHYLTVDRPNSILHAKIRYTPISDPGLCFTVLDRLSNTHWTTYFPLMEVTANTILPRLYASLVPWQQHVTDPDNLRWCLLGGTANGYDPLHTFELCIIQLHLPTWSIIARRAETYGVTPSPRYGHTATEVGDSSVVVFGGANRKRCLNDMYVLDTNSRVWREIFFSSPVPRRSFHAAVVVRRVEEQQMASFFSGCHFLNPQKKTSSRGEDGKLGKKTSRALVIVGGEDESGALHSVWHCTLNSFTMYEVHFPLLLSPSNFRLQQSDDITGGLPSSDAFRRVVLALMEKETAARQDADGHSVSQPYFSACHGSLLSVVPFYDTADPLSFLTIGGIRSPPVMLVTHLHPTGSSLKESSSLRLSEKGDEPSLTRLRKMKRRSPLLYHRLFPLDKCPPREAKEDTPTKNSPNGGGSQDSLLNIVSQCVLEDRLACWLRHARLRLRSQ